MPAAYTRRREPPPAPVDVRTAVRWMSQLGGSLGRRRDDEPGVKTLRRGYRRLDDLTVLREILPPSGITRSPTTPSAASGSPAAGREVGPSLSLPPEQSPARSDARFPSWLPAAPVLRSAIFTCAVFRSETVAGIASGFNRGEDVNPPPAKDRRRRHAWPGSGGTPRGCIALEMALGGLLWRIRHL